MIPVHDEEPRTVTKDWTLPNILITGLLSLVILLVGLGFTATTNQINKGDELLAKHIEIVRTDISVMQNCISSLTRDVARIDALQKERIERERHNYHNGDEYLRKKNGLK